MDLVVFSSPLPRASSYLLPPVEPAAFEEGYSADTTGYSMSFHREQNQDDDIPGDHAGIKDIYHPNQSPNSDGD